MNRFTRSIWTTSWMSLGTETNRLNTGTGLSFAWTNVHRTFVVPGPIGDTTDGLPPNEFGEDEAFTSTTPSGKAVFVPLYLPYPITIKSFGWLNGATVSGHVDMGIFDTAGTKLASIATPLAQSGINQLQQSDITDTYVERGTYYLAIALSSTGTIYKVTPAAGVVGWAQSLGILQQTPGFPLPPIATFEAISEDIIPVIGLGLVDTI